MTMIRSLSFLSEKNHQRAEDFGVHIFVAKLAILPDIFEHLKVLNTYFRDEDVFLFDVHRVVSPCHQKDR